MMKDKNFQIGALFNHLQGPWPLVEGLGFYPHLLHCIVIRECIFQKSIEINSPLPVK